MRTIFSNKKAGCENQPEQYGISMYVNAWQSSDHKLYVEYGGLISGCHKLESNNIQLHKSQWYHVAVHLGGTIATLYIDGTVVGSSDNIEEHKIQSDRPLFIGRYDESGIYPFDGNISI